MDGGGYLGLATAAFIRGIETHFKVALSDRFDLFVGTSTGAILALGLADGRSGEELVGLYKKLGPKVFGQRRTFGGSIFRAKYDGEPLREALTQEFGDKTLGDLERKGKSVIATAFNVTAGQPRLFKTNHSPNLTRDAELSLVDVAMASAAAPTYFPLVEVTNPRDGVTAAFCDGGVVANHPALLGYTEAISELAAAPRDVRVLSVSTPRKNLSEQTATRPPLDRSLWAWRKRLPDILMDSNSNMAHQLLERIVKSYGEDGAPRYERVAMTNFHRLEMDSATDESTKDLESLGHEEAMSNETRARLKPLILEESGDG